MALRGIQEYIARDVNNIARVEDEGNIVSIEGNIFLYHPKKIRILTTYCRRKSMLNDWSHKVRAILKKYCPGNIKKILPSSQSAWNTRFYFGHQKLCMDNNIIYSLA